MNNEDDEMELTEAQELLPFYVNGTLDPVQRHEIETLLRENAKLREELRFWQSASDAVMMDSAHAQAGHVSSEHIVDYAQGRIGDFSTRLKFEEHFQQCSSCLSEVDLVRRTIEEKSLSSKTQKISDRFFATIDRYKLKYLVPAFAIALFTIVVVNVQRQKEPRQQHQDSAANVSREPVLLPEILEHVAPTERTPSLILMHTTHVRGRKERSTSPQVLVMDSSVTSAEILLLIPHNQIRNVRYAVILRSSMGTLLASPKESGLKKGTTLDTLSVNISTKVLEVGGHDFEIVAKEILPKDYSDLEPEEYGFLFSTRQR